MFSRAQRMKGFSLSINRERKCVNINDKPSPARPPLWPGSRKSVVKELFSSAFPTLSDQGENLEINLCSRRRQIAVGGGWETELK